MPEANMADDRAEFWIDPQSRKNINFNQNVDENEMNSELKEVPGAWLSRLIPCTELMKSQRWRRACSWVFFIDDHGVLRPLDLDRVQAGDMSHFRQLSGLPYNVGEILQQLTSLPITLLHHYVTMGLYLKALFHRQRLVDTLIHVQDRVFAAHRVVLACHSMYFAKAFLASKQHHHKMAELRLRNIDPAVFGIALSFLYTGQLYVNQENVDHLLDIAHQLQISAVLFKCLDFLGRLPPHKVIDMVAEPTTKTVIEQAYKLLETPLREVIDTASFLNMGIESLELALGQDNLLVYSELEVFKAAIRWIQFDTKGRKKFLDRLMQQVRFAYMRSAEVIHAAQSTPLIHTSPYCRNRIMEAIWLMTLRVPGHEADDKLECDPCKPRNYLDDGGGQNAKDDHYNWDQVQYDNLLEPSIDHHLQEPHPSLPRHQPSASSPKRGCSDGLVSQQPSVRSVWRRSSHEAVLQQPSGSQQNQPSFLQVPRRPSSRSLHQVRSQILTPHMPPAVSAQREPSAHAHSEQQQHILEEPQQQRSREGLAPVIQVHSPVQSLEFLQSSQSDLNTEPPQQQVGVDRSLFQEPEQKSSVQLPKEPTALVTEPKEEQEHRHRDPEKSQQRGHSSSRGLSRHHSITSLKQIASGKLPHKEPSLPPQPFLVMHQHASNTAKRQLEPSATSEPCRGQTSYSEKPLKRQPSYNAFSQQSSHVQLSKQPSYVQPSDVQSSRPPSYVQVSKQPSDVQPSRQPSPVQPSKQPSYVQPSDVQSSRPPSYVQVSKQPSDVQPSRQPSPVQPSKQPSYVQPSDVQPSRQPSPVQPSKQPSYVQPSDVQPSRQPSPVQLSKQPSYVQPSDVQPSSQPSYAQVSKQPSYVQPSEQPSNLRPSKQPSTKSLLKSPASSHSKSLPSSPVMDKQVQPSPTSAGSDTEMPYFRVVRSRFQDEEVQGRVVEVEVGFSRSHTDRRQRRRSTSSDDPRSGSGAGHSPDSHRAGDDSNGVLPTGLLAIGGYVDDDNLMGQTHSHLLNAGDQRWQRTGDMQETRLHFAAACLRGKIYVTGGYDPCNSFKKTGGQATRTTFQYDPSSTRWKRVADMQGARAFHTVCVLHGRLYAMGGQDKNEEVLKSGEAYDPVADSWDPLPSMEDCRVGASSAPLDAPGVVMVVGGYGEGGGDDTATGDPCCPVLMSTERFDPNPGRWQSGSPLREPRAQASLVVVDNYLYLCGGVTRQRCTGQLCSMSDVDRYDPSSDQWTQLTNLTIARHNAGAAALGAKLYVVGGVSTDVEGVLCSVDCYDIDTRKWDFSLPHLPHGAKTVACMAITTKDT